MAALPNYLMVELSLRERFDLSYIPEPNSGCWLWDGKYARERHSDRPMIRVGGGRRRKAARVAYELFIGPIPAGLYICHKCDVPACVNPQHLYAGTPKQNQQDCIDRDRRKLGELRSHSKLTNAQARSLLTDPRSSAALARLYGVSETCVSLIRRGRTWQRTVGTKP